MQEPREVWLDVTNEIKTFFQQLEEDDLPTIDTNSIVEILVDTIDNPKDREADIKDLSFVASDIAYGELVFSGPNDIDGYSMAQRNAVFYAVMNLADHLRYRIEDLKLYNERGFNYRFKEIERDATLKLEKTNNQLTPASDYSDPAVRGNLLKSD